MTKLSPAPRGRVACSWSGHRTVVSPVLWDRYPHTYRVTDRSLATQPLGVAVTRLELNMYQSVEILVALSGD